jgi:uncharacterized protein GlcG (DUF336 family)
MEKSIQKASISAEMANLLIQAAETKAKELGLKVATSIVDESGILKAFSRMDRAPLIAVDASKKKAITAVSFGLSTGEAWYDFIKDDPILNNGVSNIKDFMLLGGGLPVLDEDQIIGAIGVSGGHYKQDEACAEYALDVLNKTS